MSWAAKRYENTSRQECRVADSTHHRKPRSIGGTNEDRNISELSVSRHRAWHILFQNWPAQRIADEINARYLDPDFEMVVWRKMRDDD